MAKKKGNEPELSAADQALVKRVDAMMDVKHSESVPGFVSSADVAPAPIDIFEGQPPVADNPTSSAPAVPSKLLKAIGEKKPKKTAALKSPPEPPPVAEPAEVAQPVEAILSVSEPESDAVPSAVADATDPLADDATDKAVDDIVSEDSDDLLKVNKLPHADSNAPATQTASAAKVQKTKHHNNASLVTLAVFTILLVVLLALYLTHHTL